MSIQHSQIGGGVNTPISINEQRWDSRKEVLLTLGGLLFTLASSAVVIWEQYPILEHQIASQAWGTVAGHALFLLIVALLIYGSLVYQITRLGYIQRRRQHQPASHEQLDHIFEDQSRKPLTILVPSYKEEHRIIFQTMMSAALQEYPKRRVMLCIDDPPHPSNPADAAQLANARELPLQIASLFEFPARRFKKARKEYQVRLLQGATDSVSETAMLADLWQQAADWFEHQANRTEIKDHCDRLYVDKVLRTRAKTHSHRARALLEGLENGVALDIVTIRIEYAKLVSLFECELESFERKRYENLSHEPNKAMNLNSYIGLVGRHFRERREDNKLFLEEVDAASAHWSVPDSDYFITLDADSIVLPDYALRLIHLMEQPGNEKLAVAQTPYSAVPRAPSELERIAGATTDMQYIIHQGFTRHNATYWVGANALLRHAALKEIAVTEDERGYPVQRFIQDRTVIEDTESSVDLAVRGWQLYNYPERLAYSATPPDFGSLIIQRRRWANGGLIILPKLLGYLTKKPWTKINEGFLRAHYLFSIAAVNIGLLIMLAFPFGESIETVWLPLTAASYFFLYGRDLVLCGYKPGDLVRVYALNLLMIPVNLGGVFKSLQQAWTKQKIPFGRTPKIQGRTAAAPLYIISAYVLLIQWLVGASFDLNDQYYAHAAFAAINAAFLLYAIRAFIGFRESWEDVTAGLPKRKIETTASVITLDTNKDVTTSSTVETERKYGT